MQKPNCKHDLSVELDCWDCYRDGIEVDGGKYHFSYDDTLHALNVKRHGEPWIDNFNLYQGGNAVRTLFFAAVDAQRKAGLRG